MSSVAERAYETGGDLTVTGDRREALAGGVAPDGVFGAFAHGLAALRAQVPFEVAALHGAMTSSSGSLSAPAGTVTGVFAPVRAQASSISRSASRTIARASSRVRPWLKTLGSSGMLAHAVTRAWASSPSAASGVVNVAASDKRAPWGLIVTQTCDLVEEGKPKRPWVQIAPVYELYANAGDRARILQGRGFDYLVPITTLEPSVGVLWVADLRLLVPVEKGWLVGREVRDGFHEQAGFDRLAAQLGRLFSRTAHATVVGKRILGPAYELLRDIAERYEGRDPIAEVGLALGRARHDPVNAQLVFILDGELTPELRSQIIDWWQPVAEQAHADGLEVLAPRFVSLDELSAREYRSLDLLDASALSPDDEEPPDAG
jgi:hypothetical protein